MILLLSGARMSMQIQYCSKIHSLFKNLSLTLIDSFLMKTYKFNSNLNSIKPFSYFKKCCPNQNKTFVPKNKNLLKTICTLSYGIYIRKDFKYKIKIFKSLKTLLYCSHVIKIWSLFITIMKKESDNYKYSTTITLFLTRKTY